MSEKAIESSKRVLEPIERVSEILFGLIMVLTFTGSLSISGVGHDTVRTMLIGALGCNLAWGLIDGVFYLMGCLTEKARALMTLLAVLPAWWVWRMTRRNTRGFPVEVAKPIEANTPLKYRFALPTANHVFLPGHRIMVQIQSSWFPLYDRNPQTFVKSIFWAKPEDYKKATQRIYNTPGNASFIELPLVTKP